MNLNELAKEVCKREGGKKQVDIAQVKEILRVLGDIAVRSNKGSLIFDKIVKAALRRAKK